MGRFQKSENFQGPTIKKVKLQKHSFFTTYITYRCHIFEKKTWPSLMIGILLYIALALCQIYTLCHPCYQFIFTVCCFVERHLIKLIYVLKTWQRNVVIGMIKFQIAALLAANVKYVYIWNQNFSFLCLSSSS